MEPSDNIEKNILAPAYLFYMFLGFVGLVLHLWTTFIAYQMRGIWTAALHLCLFIYAEAVWAYRLWEVNFTYSVLASLWLIAFTLTSLFLFIISRKLSR
ncbi:hypothetical protein DENIS_5026 [Desulfonema ishimotonii]|uniref:Uncharacterized protein n=1 Tax=Desulfonema ishimotonii TaxID=45657 RepID=A0A401G477_9BACT|nr:hypothetical protein [Desulfonema ishimotonii]GBC64026.1 hypothetical protein DENIS_5026 [Desulfonema ishimotonii]